MKQVLFVGLLMVCCQDVYGAQDLASAVVGTVKTVDRDGKVVVVQSADGVEHAFRYADRLTVHAAKATKSGAKDGGLQLEGGTKVVVHYSSKGGHETAEEIDRIGEGGLGVMKGTVTHVDRAGKTISIKTADGSEKLFFLTTRASKSAARMTAEAAGKTAKVSAYYSEEAGKKTIHFLDYAL